MAPSETTNPRKRSQPPFNPSRPKTTGSGISKSKSSTSTRKANIGSIFNEGTRKSKATAKSTTKARKQRQAIREQEPEDDDDDDDDDDAAADSLLDDEAEGEEDDGEDENDEPTEQEPDDASDADMMLAEITHDLPADEALEPSIPIPLLHRIMHHSFKTPEETKLSTDARASVGRYIETFIREGIARCAFEVGEKGQEGRSDSALGHDDGWLEVEDLERVGGQLVLDF